MNTCKCKTGAAKCPLCSQSCRGKKSGSVPGCFSFDHIRVFRWREMLQRGDVQGEEVSNNFASIFPDLPLIDSKLKPHLKKDILNWKLFSKEDPTVLVFRHINFTGSHRASHQRTLYQSLDGRFFCIIAALNCVKLITLIHLLLFSHDVGVVKYILIYVLLNFKASKGKTVNISSI